MHYVYQTMDMFFFSWLVEIDRKYKLLIENIN